MNYITDTDLEAVYKKGFDKSHAEGLRAVWNLGYDRAVNPPVDPYVIPAYATVSDAYVAPPAYVAPTAPYVAPVAPAFVKVTP